MPTRASIRIGRSVRISVVAMAVAALCALESYTDAAPTTQPAAQLNHSTSLERVNLLRDKAAADARLASARQAFESAESDSPTARLFLQAQLKVLVGLEQTIADTEHHLQELNSTTAQSKQYSIFEFAKVDPAMRHMLHDLLIMKDELRRQSQADRIKQYANMLQSQYVILQSPDGTSVLVSKNDSIARNALQHLYKTEQEMIDQIARLSENASRVKSLRTEMLTRELEVNTIQAKLDQLPH